MMQVGEPDCPIAPIVSDIESVSLTGPVDQTSYSSQIVPSLVVPRRILSLRSAQRLRFFQQRSTSFVQQ